MNNFVSYLFKNCRRNLSRWGGQEELETQVTNHVTRSQIWNSLLIVEKNFRFVRPRSLVEGEGERKMREFKDKILEEGAGGRGEPGNPQVREP